VVDPIQELAHDHRETSELLIAIHDALGRLDRGQSNVEDEVHEIGDGAEALREALLDHFAREQEGLFPFAVKNLPSVSERVDAMVADHDRIAEALTVLVREWSHAAATLDLGAWRTLLGSFEELYAAHTKAELAFLEDVAGALVNNRGATEQLRALLDAT
jgi:hemerythrin-like domain-containing protein